MKKFLIPGIVAVVILILVGAFVMMKGKSSSPLSSDTTPQNTMEKQSLRSLLELANNQECTFTDSESGSSGVVYASGGKGAGDFSSVSNGTTVASHMVMDGTNIYIWMDNQPEGFKTSLEDIEKFQSETGTQTFDINEQVDYECKAWGVDQSKFVVPTNIKFTDFGSMMVPSGAMMDDNTGDSEESSETTKAQQCASCNSLPESAKAQCLQVLGC